MYNYLKSIANLTVETGFDIAGVASSILATPTIKGPPSQRDGGLFVTIR
ncbi:hypothetical protein ACVWYO_000959 [Sphingomonas sp. UYP23]